MRDKEICARECIIPDSSIKIIPLCLNDNENGIITNLDNNKQKEHFQALEILVSKHKNNLPITVRKLLLYKQYQYG